MNKFQFHFTLVYKSLKNRKFTALLTILSIAVSVALLFAVERTQRAAYQGFTQSISQVDLLVGARSSPLNLILYTVFNMGSPTNNVSWESYKFWSQHPAVAWTIPYSLGDSHRGFRVVATDENFYKYYRFRQDKKIEFLEGKPALDIWDAVIGSDVQEKLKCQLNENIVIAHGVTKGEGVLKHDDKPFRITGILKPTGTGIDQTVFISLYGMEAVHIDWQDGAVPALDKVIAADRIKKEDIIFSTITSFFLRTKSRIETLRLQREINNYEKEPLMGIIPGVVLGDLWRGLSQMDRLLKLISWLVIIVGMLSMLSAIFSSLQQRRREMAILRSLGTSPATLRFLFITESLLLTSLGIFLGFLMQLLGFVVLQSWIENHFGLSLQGELITKTEVIYIFILMILGLIVGWISAAKAIKNTLKNGLSLRL